MLTEMERSLGNYTASNTAYRRGILGLGCLILEHLLVEMQFARLSPIAFGQKCIVVAEIKATIGILDNPKSVRFAPQNVLGDIAS